MASAALNSGLLEALVSRGVHADPHSRGVHADPHSASSRESNHQGNSPSPSADVGHHSFLSNTQFNATYNQYLGGADPNDNSTSGGDATTEDDEASVSDQSGYCYKRQNGIDQLSDNSKKRRKQSKPTRISANEEETKNKKDPVTTQAMSRESFFEREMSGRSREAEEGEQFRCPHCHTLAPSEDALRHHIIEEHIGQMLNQSELRQQQFHQQQMELANQYHLQRHQKLLHPEHEYEEGETIPLNLSSPRWEVKPSNTLREDGQKSPNKSISLPSSIPIPPSFADGKLNMPGLLPFGPPHFLFPFFHQGERERGVLTVPTNSNGTPQRVFNPEAFCDLCNKEFCNKYFLKTHKANKHGIYTPDIGGSPLGCTPLGPTTSLHTTPFVSTPLTSTPLNSTLNIPSVTTSPTIPTPITPTLNGPPFAGAFITANMASLPLRPLVPPPLDSTPKSMSFSLKNEPSSSKPNSVINFEAYCELCQKEFCNKYFLKRHKSKIHGINIDPSSKPISKNMHPISSRIYPERPEGWCDACQKDVGGRIELNSHKMHVHGPNMMPLSNSHSSSQVHYPGEVIPPRSRSSDFIAEEHEKRESQNNFSPWDLHRDNSEFIREHEASMRSLHDISDEHRERSKSPEPKTSQQCDVSERAQLDGERVSWGSQHRSPLNNMCASMNSKEFCDSWGIKEEPKPQNETSETNESNNKNEQQEHLNHTNSLENGTKNISPKSDFPLTSTDIENIRNHNRMNDSDSLEREAQCTSRNMNEMYKDTHHENQNQSEEHALLSKDDFDKENRTHSNITPLNTDAMPGVSQHNDTSLLRESSIDAPRTPGGGSSTDESSRETGLIARVGQPAMVQAPPGTKFTPDQLRQLGVINPDAFCELCCKEFCNKYFLRTHRIKKHGIFTPEYSERSRHSKENTSMNLVRLLERQATEMKPIMPEVEREVDCDLCRRTFPNAYALQMHKYYFHGPGQEVLQQEQLHLYSPQPSPQEQFRQFALQAHHNHQQQLRKQYHQRIQEQKRLIQSQFPLPMKSEDNNKIDSNMEKGPPKTLLNLSSPENNLEPNPRLSIAGFATCSEEVPANANETDTSEDLRKLQSMIFELNKQGDRNHRCHICGKDTGNKYFLRAHLMTDHGMVSPPEELLQPQEMPTTPKSPRDSSTPLTSPPTTPLSADPPTNQSFCTICKKDFFSRYILQQHLLSAHGIFNPPAQTSFMDRIRAEVESRDDRKPTSTSRSYCEICNKELCNKYFMKTHMFKMHGINLENGTPGGVTCEICNKELCSKYFLRVHKQNTHGLVEEGEEQQIEDLRDIVVCPICTRKFRNAKWLKTHLNSDHGEDGKDKWKEIENNFPNHDRPNSQNCHMCSLCGEQLPDIVALQIHVIKHHGLGPQTPHPDLQAPQDPEDDSKQSLSCSICPFTCNNVTVLYAHEKAHSHSTNPLYNSSLLQAPPELQCHLCSQAMPNIEIYQQHLLQHQLHGLLKPLFDKNISQRVEPSSTNEHYNADSENPTRLEPRNNELNEATKNDSQTATDKKVKKRWKCTMCNKKFKKRATCLSHIHTLHNPRSRGIWLGKITTQKRLYKCRKCGAVAHKLSVLKTHIAKQHSSPPRNGDSGVPTAHAQPVTTATGRFVMQPFLLNKEDKIDFEGKSDRDGEQFVPSLVYLPVARKVQRPLIVSFCLTPA